KYRSFIEDKVISFLKSVESYSSSTPSKNKNQQQQMEIKYDIQLGNQHEMQHQELMIYDFQHYFQRFPDPNDNYEVISPVRKSPGVRSSSSSSSSSSSALKKRKPVAEMVEI